jgi:signal peptidase
VRKAVLLCEAALLVTGALLAALMLFISVGPRFLPFQTLIVESGSMTPALPVGSVAIYRHETAAQVKVGQVILFAKPSEPTVIVSHRVYAIKDGARGSYFETKGDANPAPDSWQIPAVGSGWYVVGDIPLVGYAVHAMQAPTTKELLVIVPAVLLVLLTVHDILGRRQRSSLEANALAATNQTAAATLVPVDGAYASTTPVTDGAAPECLSSRNAGATGLLRSHASSIKAS